MLKCNKQSDMLTVCVRIVFARFHCYLMFSIKAGGLKNHPLCPVIECFLSLDLAKLRIIIIELLLYTLLTFPGDSLF